MKKSAEALAAYEANLTKHPNRANGLIGAAQAAKQLDDSPKANEYYSQLESFNIHYKARKTIEAPQPVRSVVSTH